MQTGDIHETLSDYVFTVPTITDKTPGIKVQEHVF